MEKLTHPEISIGMPITLLHKGSPFANSHVVDIVDHYGTPYLLMHGYKDELGDLIPVSLNDCCKHTIGYKLNSNTSNSN